MSTRRSKQGGSPANEPHCPSRPTRMKPSDITNLIQSGLAGCSRPVKSGLSLARFLVTPQRMTFAGHGEGGTWELWLVLEEQPETANGYKMVFEEATRRFGLATGPCNVFIGFYGTFIEALEAMQQMG